MTGVTTSRDCIEGPKTYRTIWITWSFRKKSYDPNRLVTRKNTISAKNYRFEFIWKIQLCSKITAFGNHSSLVRVENDQFRIKSVEKWLVSPKMTNFEYKLAILGLKMTNFGSFPLMVMPKRTNFESHILWIAIYHNVCHIFGILNWGGDVFFVWSLFKKKIFRLIYPRRLKWRKINRGEPQNKIEPSILVVRATTQINQNKIICKMQLKNRKCLKWNHNWKLFGVKPKRGLVCIN